MVRVVEPMTVVEDGKVVVAGGLGGRETETVG
jgi:hypothetical protein